MDNPLDHYWNIKLNHLKENLEKNNFEVFVAASLQEVHSIVMETLLPRIQPASISWGGSMTFVASGLYDELKQSRSMTVLDTFDKDISAEESLERRRQSLLVDLYITGTNALTESGMLVNLDMIGNRIAALTFGPKDVILIIGRNKIVPGLEEAMDRVKDIAAPDNADTPAGQFETLALGQHQQRADHVFRGRGGVADGRGGKPDPPGQQVVPVDMIETDSRRTDEAHPGAFQQLGPDPRHRAHQQDVGIAHIGGTHTAPRAQRHFAQRGKCLGNAGDVFISNDFHGWGCCLRVYRRDAEGAEKNRKYSLQSRKGRKE